LYQVNEAKYDVAALDMEPALGTPLLRSDSLVVKLPDGGVEVTYLLDATRDLYLLDHRLDGRPVLPLAMAMELMVEVAARAWPHLRVATVTNLRLLQGLVLDATPSTGTPIPASYTPCRLRVTARPVRAVGDADNHTVDITISGDQPAGTAPPRMHYRCTTVLARRAPVPPVVSIPPLEAPVAFPLSVADAYRQWLFHGRLLKGIAQLENVASSGIAAKLVSSSARRLLADAGQGPWQIDPVVTDSVMQLLILWARHTIDGTTLPNFVGTYHRYGSLDDPLLRCELRVAPETQAGPLVRATVWLLGADGRLLGLMHDLEATASTALNRLSGAL
jgi:hypothetical protein